MILTEDLFLGRGAHKTVYIHPNDNKLCVKIVPCADDTDLKRELYYRNILQRRKKKSALLTNYFGAVATNLGTGYIFERVVDYNGSNSLSIKDFLEAATSYEHGEQELLKILECFKRMLFEEKIVTSDMDPVNFLIQRIDERRFTIRIIDNIGTPAAIPLALYFDYFAAKRVKRYWKRFLERLQNEYPKVFTEAMRKKLQ